MALAGGVEREVARRNADAAEVRLFGRSLGGAAGDPVADQGEIGIGRGQLLAAAMRHLACAFFQEQAVFRYREIDATVHEFARQAEVVGVRVVAEERETKAVFSTRRAMAASCATTVSCQHGDDLVLERRRQGLGVVRDLYGCRGAEPRMLYDQARASGC